MIVKGHLKAFWKNVNANSFVIDTTENSYKIPFFSKPPSCFMKNNNTGAIQDLLHKGLIEKSESAPYPASILRKSTSGRHRPVSYPDGPMTARYRFT